MLTDLINDIADKIKWHRNGLGVFFVFYPGGVEVHSARGGRARHLPPVDVAVEAPPLRQRPAVQLRPPAVARGVDDEPRVVAVAVGLPARERHRPAGEAQRRRRQRGGRCAHDDPRRPGDGGRRVRPVVADRVGCGLLPGGVEVEP